MGAGGSGQGIIATRAVTNRADLAAKRTATIAVIEAACYTAPMPKNLAITTTCRDLQCAHCLQGYPEKHQDFSLDLLERHPCCQLALMLRRGDLRSATPHFGGGKGIMRWQTLIPSETGR